MNEEKRSTPEGPKAGPEGVDEAKAPPPLPIWRRPRWRWGALCVALFICGGLVGSFITLGVLHHRLVQGLRNPDESAVRWVARLRGKLDLTDEQADKVLAILKEQHRDFVGMIRRSFGSTHDRVAAVLDDEQGARWDEMHARIREHLFGPDARDETGDGN